MAASNDKTTWKTWLWALWLLGQLNIFAKPKHKPTHNTGGESARRAKPGAGGVEQEGGGGRGQMFWRTPPREGLLKRVWSDLAVSWTYNRKDWRFFISSNMIKDIGVCQCSQLPKKEKQFDYKFLYCKLFPVLQLAILLVKLPPPRLQLLQHLILGLHWGQTGNRFWKLE